MCAGGKTAKATRFTCRSLQTKTGPELIRSFSFLLRFKFVKPAHVICTAYLDAIVAISLDRAAVILNPAVLFSDSYAAASSSVFVRKLRMFNASFTKKKIRQINAKSCEYTLHFTRLVTYVDEGRASIGGKSRQGNEN